MKYLLLILGLIFSIKLEAKKIEGQIIFEDATVNVEFNIPAKGFSKHILFEKMQYKIVYFDRHGKKRVLKPDDALEFRFKYNDEIIRMISRKKISGVGKLISKNSNIFLKYVTGDHMKLFQYYKKSSPSPGGSTFTDKYSILQKGNGKLIKIKSIAPRKQLIQIFTECSKLSQKIKDKEYGLHDLKPIVNYYERNCLK